MNRNARIMAGGALALLLTSASAFALTADHGMIAATMTKPVLLAQADGEAPAEAAPEPLPEEQPPVEEAKPEPEAAPAPEAPAAEPAPAPEPQAEPAPEPQAAPAPEPQAEPAPEPEKKDDPAAPAQQEEVPSPQPEPQTNVEQPQAQPDKPAKTEPEAPAQAEPSPAAPSEEPAKPDEPAVAPEPTLQEPPAQAEPPLPTPAPEEPAKQDEPTQAPEPAAPTDAPAAAPAPAEPVAPPPAKTEAPNDGAEAPLFDSQKQAPVAVQPPADGSKAAQPAQPPVPAAPPAPPPASDQAARQDQKPIDVKPVTAEEGVRVERTPDKPERRDRPKGADVVREFGDRIIIQFNNQVVVESNDRPRMSRGAKDVYYEDLPRGRSRETIERPDGTRVVTIRNEYGDVIRRSRITPDDREYILSYVDEDSDSYVRDRDWRDPGLDLPPMRLDIPRDEYIYEADADESVDSYYDFLDQPPVERVERSYSVDEVKRSARIRDKTRRVDLDTLTFDFGKATIPEDQIPRLQSVAEAMEKMLAKNPAETFLIEGHTDAVGSDLANLALSDRRAEAVADALTNVFAIPPENLATQGYGEQFLKVRTQAQERENRRVAIRRITPLVTPVVAAK